MNQQALTTVFVVGFVLVDAGHGPSTLVSPVDGFLNYSWIASMRWMNVGCESADSSGRSLAWVSSASSVWRAISSVNWRFIWHLLCTLSGTILEPQFDLSRELERKQRQSGHLNRPNGAR